MSEDRSASPAISSSGGAQDAHRVPLGRLTPSAMGQWGASRVLIAAVVALGLALATACSSSSGTGSSKASPTTATTAVPSSTSISVVPAGISAAPARPSPGCTASAAVPAGRSSESLAVAGTTRKYFRYTPAGSPAGKPLPVVIDIHGLGSNADQEALVSGFEQLAATDKFVVLTPQGEGVLPKWDVNASATSHDVDFLMTMLTTVEGQVCVDTARVYSAGISNGGIMSSLLACRMADKLAAIGLVSGIRHPDSCAPARPMPIMVFWGKLDVVLPFYGGLGEGLKAVTDPAHAVANPQAPTSPPANLNGFPPVEEVVAQWAATDGCASTPTVAPAGSDVEQRTFSGCRAGAVIRFYVVSDGGHTWPGSKVMEKFNDPSSPVHKLLGTATDQVDATKLIWTFFQSYALGS